MHLEVKIPENGREKIFRDKQITNKVEVMFSFVKVLPER